MTPEQEEKFEAFYSEVGRAMGLKSGCLRIWQACLEANGIGEDGRRMDMFQGCRHHTGETAGSTSGPNGYPRTSNINPYDKVDAPDFMPPIDWESRPWATEVRIAYCSASMGPDRIGDRIMTIKRPLPSWKPKDGEAVLTRVMDHAEAGYVKGGYLYVRSHRIPMEEAECKPFDESRLGWLWREI